MTKAELRKLYRDKLLRLSAEEHEEKCLQLSRLFFSHFNISTISYIHIFIPIPKYKEVNTWLIINELQLQYPQIKVVIPRSDFTTLTMTSHIYENGFPLVENSLGISEVDSTEVFPEIEIDVVILPLLAFDIKGFRVGYGKGFYDRFLATCKKDVVKIGLSLFEPVHEISDLNAFDIPLDYCVGVDEVYNFNKR